MVLPALVAVLAPPPEAQGRALLERCEAAYSRLRSYRDSGESDVTFFDGAGKTKKMPFRTAFLRGEGFRFEFAEPSDDGGPDDRQVLWRQGGRYFYWSSRLDKTHSFETEGVFFTIGGPSGGAAERVAALLGAPGAKRVPYAKLPAKLVGTEKLEGHSCSVVRWGKLTRLWIDGGSHLLRKIVQEPSEDDPLGRTLVTTYRPEAGPPLTLADLTRAAPTTKRTSPKTR